MCCYLQAVDRTSGLHMCEGGTLLYSGGGGGEGGRAIFIDAPDRGNRVAGSIYRSACQFYFITYIKLRGKKGGWRMKNGYQRWLGNLTSKTTFGTPGLLFV